MRVVFIIIDALPNHLVSSEWTPNLWNLLSEGGWNASGGKSVLSTATYPNHATFATGRLPDSHKIFTNRVWDGEQFTISSEIGPQGDTLFKAAKRYGLECVTVVGDHHLIGVMGAEESSRIWPPEGKRIDVALDEFRYAADSAVLEAVEAIDLVSASLSFVHFNEPDTVCHIHGPDSDETKARIKKTDSTLGDFLDMLKPDWEDTVVIAVSDHDQEFVVEYGFELGDELNKRGLPGIVECEGTAALVLDGPSLDDLRMIPEVEDAVILDEHNNLVWGKPGHVFGPWLDDLYGSHGSPRCSTQVAIVGGGHPKARELAKQVSKKRPMAWEWARRINDLLGLDLQV